MNKAENIAVELYSAYLNKHGVSADIIDNEVAAELYKLAQNHQIVPMLYSVMKRSGCFDKLPQEEQTRWKNNSIQTITIQEQKNARLWYIYCLIRAAGIKSLLMKGVCLHSVYPDPCYRWSSDEDIWIQMCDFEKCDALLAAEGFTAVHGDKNNAETEHDISYSDAKSRLFIELHLNPVGVDIKTREMMNRLLLSYYDTTSEYEYEGHEYESLAPTENLIYNICHFIKHFLAQGASLRMLTDIFLFAVKYENRIDFVKLHAFLNETHFQGLFNGLACIAEKKLKLTLPDTIKCKGDIVADDLLDDIASGGAYGTFDAARSNSIIFTDRAVSDISTGQKNVVLLALFPPLSRLKKRYPKLKSHIWLLPYYWLKRLLDFAFSSNGKACLAAYRESVSRVALFKKYGIV